MNNTRINTYKIFLKKQNIFSAQHLLLFGPLLAKPTNQNGPWCLGPNRHDRGSAADDGTCSPVARSPVTRATLARPTWKNISLWSRPYGPNSDLGPINPIAHDVEFFFYLRNSYIFIPGSKYSKVIYPFRLAQWALCNGVLQFIIW
jgi:hypothetical protein